MSQTIFRQAVLPALVALTLSGCSLAPKYERPAAPVPTQYPDYSKLGKPPASAAPSVQAASDLGWRQFFRDPQLDALIGIALKNNRDMQIAVQNVLAARAEYGITNSDRFPSIGAGINGSIQRNPESLRTGGADSPSVSRVYQAGIGLTAFELDFFGRLKNLSEAAYQQYLATEQAQRTVHINLVAQVAEAYFTLRAAEQQHTLVEQTLASRQQSYSLVNAQFQSGVASALDVNQAKTQLESARADLEAIKRSEAQSQNALLLLLGESVPVDVPKSAPFGREQLLSSIPVGLPSQLLERRPDIIGAENTLLGANANIGAARAAFFPNISITGMLGFASPELAGLFGAGNHFWSFAPQLQTPIFAGGALSNSLDLAKVQKNIAVAQYEKAIQTAFREVSDTLAGEATYSTQLDALREQEKSSAQTLDIAQLRYTTGIDSFLQVQTAEVTLYSTQLALLQTGLDSLLNRVELYKALGGGWQENSVSAQPAAAAAPAPAKAG